MSAGQHPEIGRTYDLFIATPGPEGEADALEHVGSLRFFLDGSTLRWEIRDTEGNIIGSGLVYEGAHPGELALDTDPGGGAFEGVVVDTEDADPYDFDGWHDLFPGASLGGKRLVGLRQP